MARAPVRVQQNGRVTIPKDIREDYDLDCGDYVLISVEPFGEENE